MGILFHLFIFSLPRETLEKAGNSEHLPQGITVRISAEVDPLKLLRSHIESPNREGMRARDVKGSRASIGAHTTRGLLLH